MEHHAPHTPLLQHPRRTRRTREEPHVSHERWLVSYADFITLLFAFFTMMYAMSTVDAQKFRQVVRGMQVAFESQAFRDGRAAVFDPEALAGPGDGEGPAQQNELDDLQREMTERLSVAIGLNQVAVERDARGLVVSIREAGAFGVGSADLSAAAVGVLDQIGDVLASTGHAIRIEGHTDDVPINTARFQSNWELSTARATNVISFLAARRQLSARRMSAAGYAEFHPRVPNDSDANRARNRRVDIVVLDPAVARAEEPAPGGGQP
ncbi:MAG: flagellar motor protein MotB [Acidobacteriota bacterium]